MRESADVKATTCARCGHLLDQATVTSGKDARPRPGDFSVCIGCACLLVFDDELEPVLATAADMDAVPRRQRARLRRQLERAQFAVRLLNKRRRRS